MHRERRGEGGWGRSVMPKTEGFQILDVQSAAIKEAKNKSGLQPQNLVRKKLADISNQPQNQRLLIQAKSQSIETTTKEYISQLQKENMALMKMLAQRNEIIHRNGNELDRLRLHLLKMQEQNQQLALLNNQMLVELNSGKDRLKMLQHEISCKTGLLEARKLVLKGRARTTPLEDAVAEGRARTTPLEDTNAEGRARTTPLEDANAELVKSEEEKEFSKEGIDDEKPHEATRNSPRNGESPSEHDEPKGKTENKRRFLRRQSARFKSAEVKPAEDSLETRVSASQLSEDTVREQGSSSHNASVKHQCITEYESQQSGRPTLRRPSRAAAKKVKSYKEASLIVKLRRPE